MYKLAIFDFDGTLVDSAPGIVKVMAQVVDEYKLSDDIYYQWQNLIGVPLIKQMEVLFPEHNNEFHEELANYYRTIYDTRVIDICPPFPGLQEVLTKLTESNIKISIASSKRRNLILPVLEHHNLTDYFKLVIGQHDVSNHKPHPESVNYITSALQISPDSTVVIGDSSYDLEMARLAGVDGIGVTTGVHTKEVLSQYEPVQIVSALLDVLPIILNGGNGSRAIKSNK